MMNAFLNVYDDVGGVVNNHYIDPLIAIDKKLLEEICSFLNLFDQTIKELSEAEGPTIHKMFHIRQLLLNHCQITFEDSSELSELKLFLSKF